MSQPDVPQTPARPSLPHLPGSPSELLAATHVVLIGVLDQAGSPWQPGNDGLEHRTLLLSVRLERSVKGLLSQVPGSVIDVRVAQSREPGMMVSDFHGFWSHQSVSTGAGYVLLADSPGTDLAALLQEPAIKSLLPAASASDAEGANTLERHFGASLQPGLPARDRVAGGLQLLKQIHEQRARCHGLLGRYVLARIEPLFALDDKAYTAALLFIIQQPDTEPSLRETLVYGLYASTLQLGLTPDRIRGLLRPLFELLLMPQAQAMVERLVQVPIHNLLFQPGAGTPTVGELIPDPVVRARLDAVLATQKSERAQAVRAWLNKGA